MSAPTEERGWGWQVLGAVIGAAAAAAATFLAGSSGQVAGAGLVGLAGLAGWALARLTTRTDDRTATAAVALVAVIAAGVVVAVDRDQGGSSSTTEGVTTAPQDGVVVVASDPFVAVESSSTIASSNPGEVIIPIDTTPLPSDGASPTTSPPGTQVVPSTVAPPTVSDAISTLSAIPVGLTNGIAVAPNGEILVTTIGAVYRYSSATQTVTKVVGGGSSALAGPSGLEVKVDDARGVAVDASGNFYFSDDLNIVRRVDNSGQVQVVAGDGSSSTSATGNGGPATLAGLRDPRGLAVDVDGSLWIADMNHDQVRIVTPDGVIQAVGGYIDMPDDLALAPGGSAVFVTNQSGQVIRLSRDGSQSVVFDAEEVLPLSYGLRILFVAVAPDGSLLVSDEFAHRVWRVVDGSVSTVAGIGEDGSDGDGSSAKAARLASPWEVAAGPNGQVYVSTGGGIRTFLLV
ncbi:MAG: hypothetical protein ABMA25_12080 [Ilumatobacteraceae bacterium]